MPLMMQRRFTKWPTPFGTPRFLFRSIPLMKGISSRYRWQVSVKRAYLEARHKFPICREGHEMYYAGHCKDRDRQKWRCPNKVTQSESDECQCSTSDYGRVVYTHTPENLRIFPKTPRSSPTFKKVYDHRTAAERVFKRQKLDFKLTQFKTRSKGRHLFYALLTAIAVHVETWYRLDTSAASG